MAGGAVIVWSSPAAVPCGRSSRQSALSLRPGIPDQAGQTLENIYGLSQQSESGISQITGAVQSHVAAIGEISSALADVERALAVTEQEVALVSNGALQLADTAEQEYVEIAGFELDTVYDRIRHIASDLQDCS